MPRIPEAPIGTVYPLAPMPVGVAAEAGETFERMGVQVQQLGEMGQNVVNIIQRAKDHTLALQLKNSLEGDFDKSLFEFSQRRDFQNFDKDAAGVLDGLEKKYADVTKDNPRVSGIFNLYFQGKSREFSHAIKLKEIDEMTKEAEFQWIVSGDNMIQKMVQATSPEEKEAIKNEYAAETETLVGSHLLKREEAYKHLKDIDRRVEEVEVVNGLKSLDLGKIEETLNKLSQPSSFPHIDPIKKANYQAFGQKQIVTLRNKYNQQTQKITLDSAYKELKNNWSDPVTGKMDFDSAYKQLDSLAFQNEFNLDLDTKHKLEIDLGSEETHLKKATDEQHEKNFRELFPRSTNFTLPINEVEELVLHDKISSQMGEYFRHRIEEPPQAPEPRTDGIFAALTLEKVLNAKTDAEKTEARNQILWGGGKGRKLSPGATESLMRLNIETKDKNHYSNDEWFKLTKQAFSGAFGHIEETTEEFAKRRIEHPSLPAPKKDYDHYTEAMATLMRAIEKGKDGKPLAGEDIWTKGQEILKNYAMQRGQQAGKGTKPDKYGFTLGEIRINEKGITGTYVGNGQWRKMD